MDLSRGDILSRFIFSKRHFSIENSTVKYGAFIPPPNSADLSVFSVSSLTNSEIWEIGRKYVQTNERKLKARADLPVEEVYAVNLKVVPDTQPHELHANITSFPLDKRERTDLARKLAVVSRLEIIPPEDTDSDR